MKHFITCKSCRKRVTALLSNIILPEFRGLGGEPLLASGQYCIDPDGDFYIAITDKHGLKYHPDDNRMIGCCGPSSEGLPNLICSCKSEIGREISDCDTPHFIRLFHEVASVKTDHNGGLEAILCSAISEEEKTALEILWQYGQ
ncbi:hypothetical protein [Chitinophaga filiformis]|uniref:Uncharacterized protein n=1 Tax=Chitinophaga filiformis TaxID=104663 RepID=A0A1G8A4X0_CHIFI|nr:hypothetical protein [Chitinophaga filiformis]SDH15978.1 hypothetical protein SAMN04488121_109122 [Chitinophaga filiformis]